VLNKNNKLLSIFLFYVFNPALRWSAGPLVAVDTITPRLHDPSQSRALCDWRSPLVGLPLSAMASGGPVVNGDLSRSPGPSCPLEETLQQMHILIQENRELKGERDHNKSVPTALTGSQSASGVKGQGLNSNDSASSICVRQRPCVRPTRR